MEFQLDGGRYKVLNADKHCVGFISQRYGFFTDSVAAGNFLSFSPRDLMAIALKAAEVEKHGVPLPVRPKDKGM